MARNWTEEQNRAIYGEGDLLVSAAAGAGKTAVLTERIARLISEGVGLDELLVVTFTNAAAAEMKERIEKRLLELASSEPDREKALKLVSASEACGKANISTLHSFCMNVLRRNCHEAGLDPAPLSADDLRAGAASDCDAIFATWGCPRSPRRSSPPRPARAPRRCSPRWPDFARGYCRPGGGGAGVAKTQEYGTSSS